MYNQKEKDFAKKHEDVISIRYAQTSPRATVCCIVSAMIEDVYGVAIRTRTDEEDPCFARSLAFQRAVKSYNKMKRGNK